MKERAHSGFTLVELLVSILIGIIILSSMAFIFRSLANNFTAIRYVDRVYHELDTFIDDYTSLRTTSPNLFASTGGVLVGTPYGFESLAFTNSGNTAGFLLFGADLVSNGLAFASGSLYSRTVPAILTLTGGDIANIGTNFPAFLSGINIHQARLYTDLPVIKINYLPLNNSTIGKLELAITPSYYDAFQDVTINSAILDPLFEYYTFSYLK